MTLGDNLYSQIQEAVDAAAPGDKIKVHAGTYNPFVVNTDNFTIRDIPSLEQFQVDPYGRLKWFDFSCVLQ
jgi:hypothetical protein